MDKYKQRVLELFGLTEWEERMVNQRAEERFFELSVIPDIRKCIALMRENYTDCRVDDIFAFYLLTSNEYLDAMSTCIEEAQMYGRLTEGTYQELQKRIHDRGNPP